MSMDQWWKGDYKAELECHFVLHESHTMAPGIEPEILL
jgi:hypothetical protein